MEPLDSLSQFLALIRIRQRAARRNGWFLLALILAYSALSVVYFRQRYEIDWDALYSPLILLILFAVLLVQGANDTTSKWIIELIEAIQRSDAST